MILEQQKQAIVLSDVPSDDSIKMSLDVDSAQILMQMLSKDLYSDPIGSTIRETASNALDSHRKAGVKKPIIVSLYRTEEGECEFSVEDFGVGLDNVDVDNIISKYGKSTKRLSNNQLGMFGLGFKSPMAYSSSFYFVCRKNGIERKYMMYEGENVNEIDLLYQSETTENNGVRIIIPVRNGSVSSFCNKIKEQLAYFEDVYFRIDDAYDTIDNGYKIYRTLNYQLSELKSFNEMHICLDNVYYAIDWSKLGADRIYLPIALRFGLSDGIYPTPNRETIIYTEECKKIIIEKIKTVATEIVQNFNNSVEDCSFEDAIHFYKKSQHQVKIGNEEFHLSNDLLKHSSIGIIEPVVKGIKHLNIKLLSEKTILFLSDCKRTHTLVNGRFCADNSTVNFMDVINEKSQNFIHGEPISAKKKSYYRNTLSNDKKHVFFKKHSRIPLFPISRYDNTNYFKILSLHTIEKKHWREAIIEFQTAIQNVLKSIENVDELEIPKDFIEARKRISYTRRLKLEGEINCKIAEDLSRSVSGQRCKFVSHILEKSEIHRNKGLIIYDHQDNKERMDDLYDMCNNQKIKLIITSSREYENLKKLEIHNLINYETFMKGDTKPFQRIATSIKLRAFKNNYQLIFNNKEIFKNISTELYEDLKKVDDYINKNYKYVEGEVSKVITELADANKLYDVELLEISEKLNELLSKLYFIPLLVNSTGSRYSYNNDNLQKCKPIIIDLMKYYKQRLNLEHYKLNKTIKTEE